MADDLHSARDIDERAGAMRVRTDDVAWVEMPRLGAVKSLRKSPETGWAHSLIRGDAGQVNAPHTHQGPAMFYVLEGGFEFRGGAAGPGDWVWEPTGAVHEATTHTAHTIYLGTLFGPVGMHDETGKPAGYGDPIGAALVRTYELPWLDDRRGGKLRVLRTSPETGWMNLMLRGRAGQTRAAATCLGPCEMFVLEGELDYAGGRASAGDWIWEPAGSNLGELRFASDVLMLVSFYGPALYGAGDLMDWRSVRRLAGEA
jgi:quercetin dioxygenase-like cupin family protein